MYDMCVQLLDKTGMSDVHLNKVNIYYDILPEMLKVWSTKP